MKIRDAIAKWRRDKNADLKDIFIGKDGKAEYRETIKEEAIKEMSDQLIVKKLIRYVYGFAPDPEGNHEENARILLTNSIAVRIKDLLEIKFEPSEEDPGYGIYTAEINILRRAQDGSVD